MKTMLFIFCCFLLFSCTEKENPQVIYFSVSDVGAITGRIISISTDTIRVAGAMITTCPATHKVFSDSSGNYTLPGMPPGDYKIMVSKEGFYPDSTTVSLIDWRTVRVNLTLTMIQTIPGFAFTGQWTGNIGPSGPENSMQMDLTQIGNDSITGTMIISYPGIPGYMTNPNVAIIQSALYFEKDSFRFYGSAKNLMTGDNIRGEVSGKLIAYKILSGKYYFTGTNGVPFDLPFWVQRNKK